MANAVPATVVADGCVVNASLFTAAGIMEKAGLVVAVITPAEDADKTLLAPAKFIFNPLNVATPEDALTVVVPLKVPVPVVKERVILAVDDVTVFPN